VFNNLDDKEFLKQLGGYTVNRETQEEGLTMAGLLMFGKGLPIRERFSNLRMDYIDKTNLIGGNATATASHTMAHGRTTYSTLSASCCRA